MKRGPYGRHQRQAHFERAIEMRRNGDGYRTIARAVGVPWSTIRNWLRDEGIVCDRVAAYNKSTESRRVKAAVHLKQRGSVRMFLIRTRGYRCSECGLSLWREKKLPLEVEHINGVRDDNRDENVKLLCPNCHSLTPTWRGRKRAIHPGVSTSSGTDRSA